eukprot:SAG31_NODE_3560_length_4122_cov_6.095451_3_plen_162_part_00
MWFMPWKRGRFSSISASMHLYHINISIHQYINISIYQYIIYHISIYHIKQNDGSPCRPHVDPWPIGLGAQQQLRRSVPQRDHLVGVPVSYQYIIYQYIISIYHISIYHISTESRRTARRTCAPARSPPASDWICAGSSAGLAIAASGQPNPTHPPIVDQNI